MKISDVIVILQEMLDKYGDLPVYIDHGWIDEVPYPSIEIYYDEEYQSKSSLYDSTSERIVIADWKRVV